MDSLRYCVDFGTSNSLLAAVIDGKVLPPAPLDPSARDPSILRSVLFFPGRDRCFFGAEAVREFVRHDMEGRFLRSIKKFLPSPSFGGTQIGGRVMTLEEIVGTFLGEMKKRADAHYGRDVRSLLLGRPAKYSPVPAEDELAEARMARAAKFAGFDQVEFCPEPVAAAHGFASSLSGEKLMLVGDFGGGTSDFTVIRISRRAFRPEDVLSIGGVSVAGDALDGAVMRKRISRHFGAEVQYRAPFGSNVLTMPVHLMEKICSPADIQLLRERDTMEFFRQVRGWSLGDGDRHAMDQLFALLTEQFGFELFEEIERVKRALSEKSFETLGFRYPGIAIEERIERKEFEAYAADPVGRIFSSLDETLKAAGVTAGDIDLVCSTGGTAKVAAIQAGLESRFGREKVEQQNHFHSIVQGLARIASS
ncbi:MAG: Hsp70 family protein [Bdellovibrionota bacterium]